MFDDDFKFIYECSITSAISFTFTRISVTHGCACDIVLLLMSALLTVNALAVRQQSIKHFLPS